MEVMPSDASDSDTISKTVNNGMDRVDHDNVTSEESVMVLLWSKVGQLLWVGCHKCCVWLAGYKMLKSVIFLSQQSHKEFQIRELAIVT